MALATALALPVGLGAQLQGSVAGRVTSADTGVPLAGVAVTASPGGGQVISGRDGAYRLVLPVGERVLRFELFGYLSVERTVSVREGTAATLDVSLTPTAFALGEIVVTGVSRWGQEVIEAPAAVSVVEPERHADLAATGQVPRLLTELPGVYGAQSGVHDYNLNVRGFNSYLNRRLLVLLDGRDVSLAILGNQEWSALPTSEDGARVEVIRGPGSAIYGANALNGVVNIVTPEVRDATGTLLSVGGGELSTFRAEARQAGLFAGGRWGYRVQGSYYRSDSWDRSRTNLGDLEAEYADATDAEVVPPAPGYEVAPLNGQTKEGPSGLPGDALGVPDPLETFHVSARADYYGRRNRLLTLEAGSSWVRNQLFMTALGRSQVRDAVRPWARATWASELVNVTAFYSGRSSDDQVNLASGAQLREASSTLHLEAFRDGSFLAERGRYVVGGSVRNSTVDSQGTLLSPEDDGRSDQFYGLFGQVDFELVPGLELTAAARFDDGTLFDAQFSPKAGVVFKPSPDHAFRVTASRAFQTATPLQLFLALPAGPPADLSALEAGLRASPLGPSLAGVPEGELFTNSASVPALARGNGELKPTEVRSLEAGYKGRLGGRAFVTVDAYYSRLRDFVTEILPGVNPAYAPWTAPAEVPEAARPAVEAAAREAVGSGLTRLPEDGSTAIVISLGNAGEAREWGMELGAGWLLTDALRLDASYAYYEADVNTSTLVPGDSILPNTPTHRGRVQATLDRGPLRVGAGVTLTSGYDWRTGLFRGAVPDHQTVDANLRYALGSGLTLGLVGTNLFDQRRYQVFGGSVIGRRLLLSMSWAN